MKWYRAWQWAGGAVLALTVGTVASAQRCLCVVDHGKVEVVCRVHRGHPYVMEGGKLVEVTTNQCALLAAKEFLPVFVSVRDVYANSSSVNVAGTADDINNVFTFRAEFVSPYALPHVFLVLDLNTEPRGKSIFFYEVGDMVPGRPAFVSVNVPLNSDLGSGHYRLHLFCNGREVFQSLQPFEYREHALDEMVLKRIAGIRDQEPKPFVGPTPAYPKALLKARRKGEATVKIRISPTGVVLDPVVNRASDPAFGESALEAVRQWRFLPKIEHGHPVATMATMPFEFRPPSVSGKK